MRESLHRINKYTHNMRVVNTLLYLFFNHSINLGLDTRPRLDTCCVN